MIDVESHVKISRLLLSQTLPLRSAFLPRRRVIVIAGPTAVGKTKISLELARHVGGEIISADAIQVYRGMDIGTAKATTEERRRIPHHLIDICDLSESFNVVQFYSSAVAAIREVFARNRVPIVVGGTGFYIHALLYGPPQGPPASREVRQQLMRELADLGIDALYRRLSRFDPTYGKVVHPRDLQKIIRGLEIISLTGRRVSDFAKARGMRSREFGFQCWFIYLPREELYPRIEMRCDRMIVEGLIEEVERLERMGIRENPSAARAIGYCQCLKFLNSPRSDWDWEHFVWSFKKASRHFARRQFIWFRREMLFRWVHLGMWGYEGVIASILREYGK